ncbi:calcium/sodium antiporter [Demequina lutea]|uniref:Cation:H+ antiporter n=1 Tax=Demequina lutea TaxID=431489 RepID=A0A7Y9ZAW6_9MICO|nr:calcium/sodium antiporter [Demequina lutea]NYI42022.1 cation:H+ antiporter [Demequina lutea]
MILAILATVIGLAALAWSAARFVDGAAAVARYLGMPALLVGMLVIGFGTSAPELVVSVFAAAGGQPELAFGNALGSNIANIGLILGVTAVVTPVLVHRGILRKELPVLLGVTVLLGVLTFDKHVSRADAVVLLAVLVVLIVWSILVARRSTDDELGKQVEAEAAAHPLTRRAAWGWLIAGLLLLVVSSRVLVWGAVAIAKGLGWSDLVIGLTVVALGTSAPELASSIAAARKGENDLALGNVIGSNLFNTLGVIGLAGVISPAAISADLVMRDIPVVFAFASALVVFAVWPLGRGRVTRIEGLLLVAAYVAYLTFVFTSA